MEIQSKTVTPDSASMAQCPRLRELLFQHLCPIYRKHYKEYLVDRINKAQLDPLPLYEKDGNIEIILKREEKPVPEKEEDETDDHYKQRLIEVCQPL